MKLIDVLVMISKGELKEGTKVKINDKEYSKLILDTEEPIVSDKLNVEVELIEPECKHEWSNYSVRRLSGRTEFYRSCDKCGITEEREPEHIPEPTKMIKELDNYEWQEGDYDYQIELLYRKLNEVIRVLNKRRDK